MTGPVTELRPGVSQTLSVVIPVYRAGSALEATCREILEVCTDVSPVPSVAVRLEELILVCDNPGLPDEVLAHLSGLADLDERVRVVWLARNFGQHPATVAGIVSTNGDWVVTMDEDGQHDPAFIQDLLATAGRNRTPLVYAAPTNARPHGAVRNAASWVSGRVARSVSGVPVRFHSFRLLEGGLARSACAYAGENVFLDVALAWTCGTPSACPVELRQESVPSSYSYRKLLSHFWRLVVSSGTRPLRAIAAAGILVAVSGLLVGGYFVGLRLTGGIVEPGWTSVMVVLLVLLGGLFIAVAVVAEYVGQAVRNTVGRPVYVRVDAPDARALHVLHTHLLAADEVGADEASEEGAVGVAGESGQRVGPSEAGGAPPVGELGAPDQRGEPDGATGAGPVP
jgi:glycosyltransferase involved in cell wall biosynthesis